MKTIKRDLLKRLHLGITALMEYIEAAPPGKPLVWFVDRKTPVSTLPDFRYARQAADEVKKILESGFTPGKDKSMGKAQKLFEQAFDKPRNPRSPAYKQGVLAALKSRIEDIRYTNLYKSGTAKADAFWAGTDEGNLIWRRQGESS